MRYEGECRGYVTFLEVRSKTSENPDNNLENTNGCSTTISWNNVESYGILKRSTVTGLTMIDNNSSTNIGNNVIISGGKTSIGHKIRVYAYNNYYIDSTSNTGTL